jgi:AcrR family transcriptional regulator
MSESPYQPRKRPVQERSQITWDAILEAAAHILIEDGYSRLTTNRVAERAGVSIGSLYQYFPNKEAIVATLVERQVEQDRYQLERVLDQIEEMPLKETIHQLVGALLQRCREEEALAAALREQIPRVERTGTMQDALSLYEEMVVELLQKRFPSSSAPLQMIAFMVVQAVDAILRTATYERPDWIEKPEFQNHLETLVQQFLAAELIELD